MLALESFVPYGRTATYGELAAALGRPRAARAVGMALGSNPLCVVLPCHRIVGAKGSLTGYAGGVPAKRFPLGDGRGRLTGSPAAAGRFPRTPIPSGCNLRRLSGVFPGDGA